MTYKEKLIQWNSTEKYNNELDFLYTLIQPEQDELILDFGCGIMTAIQKFNSYGVADFLGYDVAKYGEVENYHLYDKELNKKYNTIFLNHSIAHIQNPIATLMALRSNLCADGKIVIVTPNKRWLDDGYNNDKTVVKHYDLETLSKLATDSLYRIEQVGQFGDVKRNVHLHNRLNCERLFIILR